MALVTWSDRYSVGVASVDAQHKKLFDLINELHDAMGSGKGKEVVGKIVAGLVDYTKTHFTSEERLLEKHGYPALSSHTAVHAAMTQQVIDLQKKLNEAPTMMSVEVLNFLKTWLTDHIQGTDKKYSEHLKSKGAA